MTARELRRAIAGEAQKLARLEALVGLAAHGVAQADVGHDGGSIDQRDAWESVAASIAGIRDRLDDIAAEPKRAELPTSQVSKRRPSLHVVPTSVVSQ